MKALIGWILATASIILGVLWFFGVITFIPPEPLTLVAIGLGKGIGWIFGTALPGLGDIILDRLRTLSESAPAAPPPTTTVP